MALNRNSRSNGLDAGETRIFISPSLKNVGVTGPYMHDGRIPTLEQVVENQNSGVQAGPALDNRLMRNGTPQRLNLSAANKAALNAYLADDTLTGKAMLRDLVNATTGFEGLAAEVNRSSKSLHRRIRLTRSW